jgi:D-beta-D-heptose 7-phosphate kinase/D-beta-D-heptose 1-phosphate adenosyltransferase
VTTEVEGIVSFNQVQQLQPDVIVKGGDYSPETIVGAEVVRARGGRVVVIPLVPDQSTTSIIAKLQRDHAE